MLFQKKEYVCEKCGKTFSKRLNLNGNLCDECWNKEQAEKRALEEPIRGYVQYASDVFYKSYSPDEMKQILNHKNAVLNKCRKSNGISRSELQNASDNYRKLTNEEAADILLRVANSSISSTTGAAYSDTFFVPTQYEGIIVDAEDIFAVGYTTDHRHQDGQSEVILCAVFTNDPYIPVFPMVYVGQIGFLAFTKSKRGREGVTALFESICPNLTYPVGDLKQLKKMIKQETSVKGNLNQSFILDQISHASDGNGIFNTKKMYSDLPGNSIKMLDDIGYIQDTEINSILKMDKMFNGNYWKKQIARLTK